MRRLISSDGERGAVAVIVAMSATVLILFAGLAIDVGASIAKRTELQIGAEAAALALAQEIAPDACAGPLTGTTTWVQQNVRNDAGGATGEAHCAEVNEVRVDAEAEQEHWFLPIVGMASSDIGATASAAWGVPIAGGSSLPIAISQCSFSRQVDGEDTIFEGIITIHAEHPNDPLGTACHKDFPPGGFGWIQPEGGQCSSSVTLGPGGTYGTAPVKPGNPQPDECETDNSFMAAVDSDEPVLIPIFSGTDGSGSGANYHITRFAAFNLLGYYIHNKLGGYGMACTPAKHHCLVGEFVEYVDLADGMDLKLPSPVDQTFLIKLTG